MLEEIFVTRQGGGVERSAEDRVRWDMSDGSEEVRMMERHSERGEER